MKKFFKFSPVFWGSLSFIIGAVLALFVASREISFLNANPDVAQSLPTVSPAFPVLYFFGSVLVIGLVLFLIPVAKLKWVFRAIFFLLYSWGVFVVLTFTIQAQVIIILIISVGAGLAWLFRPSIWLQNVLMLMALAGLGAEFGVLITPWPVMAFLLIVAVYDFLAVRFGYMIWMANKMSQSDSLPAFVIPKTGSNWNHNLKTSGPQTILAGESSEREFAILGGGDIGFPLILMVSVYANFGLVSSIITACFSLAGLIAAFAIQSRFLKGKPMPALPPIAIASLTGLLIVQYLVK